MQLHIHIHHHNDSESEVIQKLNTIIMNQEQLAAELTAVKDQNEKARVEILAKIADLEAAVIAAGEVTQPVADALAALKASVQTDDDIVADPV